MLISKETILMLESSYVIGFYDNYYNEVPAPQATRLSIHFEKHGNDIGEMINKTMKAAKKELTFECVIGSIFKDSICESFAPIFEQFLSTKGLNVGVYATTYGIGLNLVFNCNQQEQASKIDNILKELGIEYKNEFSDTRWVLRYKISKSKLNVNKIAIFNALQFNIIQRRLKSGLKPF